MGLASRIVPDDEVEVVALATARHLVDQSAAAIAATIEAVVMGEQLSKAEAIELERELCARIRGSDDFWEGFHAFVEKRRPRYGQKKKEPAE